MKQRQFGKPEIPLFFKFWFAFVGLVMVCIIVGYVIATVKVVGALQNVTPDAIGSVIGKAVAAYQKEVK